MVLNYTLVGCHWKKVTVTTNNRIQAGFNSARRKKAKHWTQNQFTNRMHSYQKNTNLFGNVQNVYSSSDWQMICFYSNIGCSESKVIFKWRKNNNKNKKSLYKEQTFAPRVFHSVSVRTLTERDKQTQAIRDAQKLAQNVFPPWKTNIDVT